MSTTPQPDDIEIRPYRPGDRAGLWACLEPVIRAGETYSIAADLSADAAIAYWTEAEKTVFVAVDGETVLGTYYMRTNALGGGAHVCNCGYITHPEARGRGVAARLCAHSQDAARAAGYRAMQFNRVVSTNEGAVRLWKRLGYDIVGVLPGAFEHPAHGDVDAYVMYKSL